MKKWELVLADESLLGKIRSKIFGRYPIMKYDELKLGPGFMEAVNEDTNTADFWRMSDIVSWHCIKDYSETAEKSKIEYMEMLSKMNMSTTQQTNQDEPSGDLYQ